jgi:hypothetical protein
MENSEGASWSQEASMWDTVEVATEHLSHDLPCPRCGHAGHRYLACDHHACGCAAHPFPGDDLAPLG